MTTTQQMKNILIIDTETTGTDPADGACVIEVAGILFDVGLRDVVAQCSFLLPSETNDAEHINRIRPELTRSAPWLRMPMLKAFYRMARGADYAVAHNAEFDRKWFKSHWLPELGLQWICTMDDVRWPRNSKRGRPSVTSLALDYGVPVWSAHRALTDCVYLAEVMKREPDLTRLLIEALEPKKVYVSLLPFEERQQCKDAGFVWDQIAPKAWAKKLRPCEAEQLGFPVCEADL
jgi:DNA polymerase-3 subunit epsilon